MSDMADIQNAVLGFFEAVDHRDWARAENLMRAPFHLDYSSFGAGPAADLEPTVILEGWKGILPGFDATHHQLGPLFAEVDGARARVRAYVTALHFLGGAEGGQIWTVVGTYDIALEQAGDLWRLSGLTFNFKFQDGNLQLPKTAHERAAS